MPQMPGMPSSVSDESDSKLDSSPIKLSVPLHDEEVFKKPLLNTPDSNNSSTIAVPLISKQGIEVVAIRKGFYNRNRYKEGDKFFIRSEEQFGEWMKCVDPILEKKRIELYKSKKAKK